jgi:hypothetical protein
VTGSRSSVQPVTLEITLAPPDLRHVEHVLPNQLRTWAQQVSEILCVVDLRPVPGRPDASWELDGKRLVELVDACAATDIPTPTGALSTTKPTWRAP